MVGWHHRLNGHEFEQPPGDGEGQGSLVCYSPWGRKESDMTEQLNITNKWRLRLVDRETGQVGGRGEGRMNGKTSMETYTLLHVK